MRSGPLVSLILMLLLCACSHDEAAQPDAAVRPDARGIMKSDLERIYEGAVAYYGTTHTDFDHAILAQQYPVSEAKTPAQACCAAPMMVCADDTAFLDQAGWMAVGFFPTQPQLFQFEFITSGIDATAQFEARATGDPDCNGHVEVWHIAGKAIGGTQTKLESPVEQIQ